MTGNRATPDLTPRGGPVVDLRPERSRPHPSVPAAAAADHPPAGPTRLRTAESESALRTTRPRESRTQAPPAPRRPVPASSPSGPPVAPLAELQRLRVENGVLRERVRAVEALARERLARIEDLRVILRVLQLPPSAAVADPGLAGGPLQALSMGDGAMPRREAIEENGSRSGAEPRTEEEAAVETPAVEATREDADAVEGTIVEEPDEPSSPAEPSLRRRFLPFGLRRR